MHMKNVELGLASIRMWAVVVANRTGSVFIALA